MVDRSIILCANNHKTGNGTGTGRRTVTECLTELYNILVSKYGKVTITRGLDQSYLGMRFQFYHHERTVNISMWGFISDIITQSGLTGKSASPANENLFITKESPLLDIESDQSGFTHLWRNCYICLSG